MARFHAGRKGGFEIFHAGGTAGGAAPFTAAQDGEERGLVAVVRERPVGHGLRGGRVDDRWLGCGGRRDCEGEAGAGGAAEERATCERAGHGGWRRAGGRTGKRTTRFPVSR